MYLSERAVLRSAPCARSGSREFFEKPWLPAGSFNQLWTISQGLLPPAQPSFGFLGETMAGETIFLIEVFRGKVF